jgi:hypothetical protein
VISDRALWFRQDMAFEYPVPVHCEHAKRPPPQPLRSRRLPAHWLNTRPAPPAVRPVVAYLLFCAQCHGMLPIWSSVPYYDSQRQVSSLRVIENKSFRTSGVPSMRPSGCHLIVQVTFCESPDPTYRRGLPDLDNISLTKLRSFAL